MPSARGKVCCTYPSFNIPHTLSSAHHAVSSLRFEGATRWCDQKMTRRIASCLGGTVTCGSDEDGSGLAGNAPRSCISRTSCWSVMMRSKVRWLRPWFSASATRSCASRSIAASGTPLDRVEVIVNRGDSPACCNETFTHTPSCSSSRTAKWNSGLEAGSLPPSKADKTAHQCSFSAVLPRHSNSSGNRLARKSVSSSHADMASWISVRLVCAVCCARQKFRQFWEEFLHRYHLRPPPGVFEHGAARDSPQAYAPTWSVCPSSCSTGALTCLASVSCSRSPSRATLW